MKYILIDNNSLNLGSISVTLDKTPLLRDKLDFLYKTFIKLKEQLILEISFHRFFNHFKNGHFKDTESDPIFTSWFLKYNAEQMFNNYINNKEFVRRLESNRSEKYLQDELDSILNEEKNAEALDLEIKNNIARPYKQETGYMYLFNKSHAAIEILRVLDGNYYLENITEHGYQVIASPEVKAYFRHILLRSFLKTKIHPKIQEKDKKNLDNSNSISDLELDNIPNINSGIIAELASYGFHQLEKVQEKNINKLLAQILKNDIPYQIAYLHYLGFIKLLEVNYCRTKQELHKLLSKILQSKERSIRGNINGIQNIKSTDRSRYTAYLHIKQVEIHYETLK